MKCLGQSIITGFAFQLPIFFSPFFNCIVEMIGEKPPRKSSTAFSVCWYVVGILN